MDAKQKLKIKEGVKRYLTVAFIVPYIALFATFFIFRFSLVFTSPFSALTFLIEPLVNLLV